jgi:HrpA-like RNA helicase
VSRPPCTAVPRDPRRSYTGALVLPLYASMSRAQQMAVFQVSPDVATATCSGA